MLWTVRVCWFELAFTLVSIKTYYACKGQCCWCCPPNLYGVQTTLWFRRAPQNTTPYLAREKNDPKRRYNHRGQMYGEYNWGRAVEALTLVSNVLRCNSDKLKCLVVFDFLPVQGITNQIGSWPALRNRVPCCCWSDQCLKLQCNFCGPEKVGLWLHFVGTESTSHVSRCTLMIFYPFCVHLNFCTPLHFVILPNFWYHLVQRGVFLVAIFLRNKFCWSASFIGSCFVFAVLECSAEICNCHASLICSQDRTGLGKQ